MWKLFNISVIKDRMPAIPIFVNDTCSRLVIKLFCHQK